MIEELIKLAKQLKEARARLALTQRLAVIVALSIFHAPNAPVIQLAMLNTVGGTRGTDMNELATLQGTWKESPVQHFSSASELEAWEKNWPKWPWTACGQSHLRCSGRGQSIWAFPRKVFPKNLSFGEG